MPLRLAGATAAVVALVGSFCSGGAQPAQPDADAVRPTSGAHLADPAPCEGTPGFTCSTLTVPLDHDHRVPGTLDLNVAVADNADAPRGVLLVLSGGPGQPGVSLVNRVKEYFDPQVLSEYRMVMFDQRGTGPAGINCAELQAAVGGADFTTPPADAVKACAAQLGDSQGFYGTPDTVEDMDALRQALGADTMAVDGVSYGTFTGEQYALRYPSRVTALVADSVVPHNGFDPLPLDHLRTARRVLADACRKDATCTTDPVADLAWLVRHGTIDGKPINGTDFVEGLAIQSLSTINPTYTGVPQMLHDARNGDYTTLKQFFQNTSSAGGAYEDLSGGLHMATLCSDLRFPWGDASAPLAGRKRAADRAAARIRPGQVYPYDRTTARNVLVMQGCQHWAPTRPSHYPRPGKLLPPTLLLSGTHDLFCPTRWARRELRHTAHGRLVVTPNGGHGGQGSRTDFTARDAVTDFLLR